MNEDELMMDELDEFETAPESQNLNLEEDPPLESLEDSEGEDFLTSLLKSRGIEDKSKIMFENEDGIEEEVNWDSLSNTDKLNIINSTNSNPETDLDDSEIQLINNIRSSKMSPEEYMNYVGLNSVQLYLQNTLDAPVYSTDQYSDDELFVMDLMARMGDITNEEAQEALERAKANETLYAKLIGAIRNEYKRLEDEINRQALLEQELKAQEEYGHFAGSIVDLINNFTEFSGYELNLENEDMQELYEFITGFDAAGNNHFAKALADPKTLVTTAYLALNGRQMINDITDYFQKEITQVRKESYAKGKADALNKKDNSQVVFKQNNKKKSTYTDDLDDF